MRHSGTEDTHSCAEGGGFAGIRAQPRPRQNSGWRKRSPIRTRHSQVKAMFWGKSEDSGCWCSAWLSEHHILHFIGELLPIVAPGVSHSFDFSHSSFSKCLCSNLGGLHLSSRLEFIEKHDLFLVEPLTTPYDGPPAKTHRQLLTAEGIFSIRRLSSQFF